MTKKHKQEFAAAIELPAERFPNCFAVYGPRRRPLESAFTSMWCPLWTAP
jgi:hypothetical protein